MRRIAVYPGTFDPVTYGHLDLIIRAARLVDHLVIGVAGDTANKQPVFSLEERTFMMQECLRTLSHPHDVKIETKPFCGLLVNFATQVGASLIIRGVRAVTDFEYEFQMSCINAHLHHEVETIFLPASEKTHFISSRLVREVARLGGDVHPFVPDIVEQKLKEKLYL
jgi:pantetheine-phosphate adenylyltransferase